MVYISEKYEIFNPQQWYDTFSELDNGENDQK